MWVKLLMPLKLPLRLSRWLNVYIHLFIFNKKTSILKGIKKAIVGNFMMSMLFNNAVKTYKIIEQHV